MFVLHFYTWKTALPIARMRNGAGTDAGLLFIRVGACSARKHVNMAWYRMTNHTTVYSTTCQCVWMWPERFVDILDWKLHGCMHEKQWPHICTALITSQDLYFLSLVPWPCMFITCSVVCVCVCVCLFLCLCLCVRACVGVCVWCQCVEEGC